LKSNFLVGTHQCKYLCSPMWFSSYSHYILLAQIWLISFSFYGKLFCEYWPILISNVYDNKWCKSITITLNVVCFYLKIVGIDTYSCFRWQLAKSTQKAYIYPVYQCLSSNEISLESHKREKLEKMKLFLVINLTMTLSFS
jgi:hypothetical protein